MRVNGSILVVDDEPEMRATLVRYLGSEGFSVTAAGDGQAMFRAERWVAGINPAMTKWGKNQSGLIRPSGFSTAWKGQ